MYFSKTAAHAILILMYMAQPGAGAVISTRKIASFLGLSNQATLKVLNVLANAGLVLSRPGRHGGFELAMPPEQITLLLVVEAVEGPLGAKDRSRAVGTTPAVEAVHDVAYEANELLRRFLASKSVTQLVGNGESAADESED